METVVTDTFSQLRGDEGVFVILLTDGLPHSIDGSNQDPCYNRPNMLTNAFDEEGMDIFIYYCYFSFFCLSQCN